jgi:prepilin-type N-terminal cleavage/methylation domain-containing protein
MISIKNKRLLVRRSFSEGGRIKDNKGFTLIEVIVYLALFAILFGGAIAAAYNVIESSGRNQAKANLQEEGEFLLAKINWVLSGVQSISIPAVGNASSQLSVSKVIGLDNGQPIIVYLSLRPDGTNMVIDKGSGPVVLNNSNTYVSQLVFTHASVSGQGINPESVAVRFVLSTKTPNGMDMSQEFSTSVYLRK